MRRLAAVILGSALSVSSAPAQEHPISFTLRAPTSVVAPGSRARLNLDARIAFGWHLYSLTQSPGGPVRTSIAIVASRKSPFSLAGNIIAPPPDSLPDRNFNIITESYTDSVRFRVPVAVPPSLPGGGHEIRVAVSYQTCNDRYCLPPTIDTLVTELVVADGAAKVSGGVAPTAAASTDSVLPTTAAGVVPSGESVTPVASSTSAPPILVAGGPSAPPESRSLFLWLAISMGLLSLLTPCVFPMVPITVSYFSNRVGHGRLAAVRGAGLYAVGIVAAFTGLGLVTTMLFGATGLNRLAADPWLNLAITTLFVVFALGLLGWVNVGLPATLVAHLDNAGRRGGTHASALLMGLTFALTSFTCTAPFVGTLLVSASQGDWRWPTVGLLVFSTTFALPFIALALVPSMLARLPRSGEWMVTLKTSMAFLELAAAAKFLSNADLVWGWRVLSRDVVLAIWIAIGLLLVLYLSGILRVDRALPRVTVGWGRRIAAAVVMLVVARLAFGLGGRRLGELEAFLPPVSGAAGQGTASGELSWITNDYTQGLAMARAERKPVLIDFTGYTCTNCRWMEANMFPRVAVRDELSRFVRVRLFTDGRGEPYISQQAFERATFKTVALPLYAVIDASGTPRATFLGMTRDEGEFVRFLARARSSR
jgi:thiol:disulfide interchange protein DsbD